MKEYINKKAIARGKSTGFTLIEIVIVLAIAALIIVAILLAVQGAQKSRRDAQRRDAATAIGAMVEESAGNRNGNYPGAPNGATGAQFAIVVHNKTTAPNHDPALGVAQPTDSGDDGAPVTEVDYNPVTVTYAVGALPACPAYAAVSTVRVFTNDQRQWRVCMDLETREVFSATNL